MTFDGGFWPDPVGLGMEAGNPCPTYTSDPDCRSPTTALWTLALHGPSAS